MYSELPEDWNILRPVRGRVIPAHLENNLYNVEESRGHEDTKKAVVKQWQFYWGTHMVIYTGASIDMIIEQLDQNQIHDIDAILSNVIKGHYAFGKNPKNTDSLNSPLGKEWVMANDIGGSNTFN